MQTDDLPLPQCLRIGKLTIGLIGLDRALSQVLSRPELAIEQAASQVFAEVAAQNYVPDSATEAYQRAITREIELLRGNTATPTGELIIRILGPGCVSCNNLQKMVIEVMAELNLAADLLQIHDLDEIGRFGIMRTPALLINGALKSAGRLPSRAQIEEWLRAI